MVVVLVVLIAAGGIIYRKAVKPTPPDNAQLTQHEFTNLMGSGYTEILLVFGNALKGDFMVGVYKTADLNGYSAEPATVKKSSQWKQDLSRKSPSDSDGRPILQTITALK